MKTIPLLIVTIFLLMCASKVKAQDTTGHSSDAKYKYSIGAGAGFATGYGLSFRYLPERFGAQVNFAPYKDSETERYSVGLTFIYKVIESKITNLFLYQANHYYYNSEMVHTYNPVTGGEEKTRTTDSYFNNGLGFGIEIIMAKRIGLNLMAGYAFYDNFQQLNITGETALYYKF
jgi:hypothetical protein